MAPLLFLAVLLLVSKADAYLASCISATCGGHDIHYPFRLNSSTSHCGYPALDLVCEDNTTLILPVRSHRYRVSGINYDTHTVTVSDADAGGGEFAAGCPRLHVNLTIDAASSWLQLTTSDSNVTTFLYNCTKSVSWSSAVALSGSQGDDGKRSYVLPDGGITGAAVYEYECEEVVAAPVLDAHKMRLANGSFGGALRAEFQLVYNAHSQQCEWCERSAGWCGYGRNQTYGRTGFTCFCDGGPTRDRCECVMLTS